MINNNKRRKNMGAGNETIFDIADEESDEGDMNGQKPSSEE